MAKLPGET